MQGMFEACYSLKNITVSSFNTSNVTTMSYMFMGCSSLSSLNLSNFNTSKVTYANSMFENCNNLLNYTKPVGVLLSTSESSVSNTEIILTDISNSTEKDKILEFFNNGYISGYLESDGTYSFKPENPMTRAEFVKLANRVFGFVRRGSHSFTDVSSSDWFYNDVLIAMNEGYITGYSDNTFRPNEPITREEIAVIISRIKNLRATKIVNFKDLNEVGNYAKDAVMAVYNYGIVSGYSDNTFRPKENAKRQHVVKMLYNASKITLKDSN
jgi:surface protein